MTPMESQLLGNWLKNAVARLREAGVESPELSASLILSEVTGYSKSRIIAFADEPLQPDFVCRADRFLERRLRHEPMAYLLGRKEFRNLTLRVSPAVLIPRPETEELIDLIWERYPHANRILDAGVGSGCIPLSLAEVFVRARILGVDFSLEALQIARSNDPAGRVGWVQSDWLTCFGDSQFDLITSNPPYLDRHEMRTLEPQVRNYEPTSALDGGEDGCEAYRSLIPQIARCLGPRGKTALEISPTVESGVTRILGDGGFSKVETHRDLSGRIRFATAVMDKD